MPPTPAPQSPAASPPYDHAEITAALGNRVVLEALSGIARRREDAATAPPGTRPNRYWTDAELR